MANRVPSAAMGANRPGQTGTPEFPVRRGVPMPPALAVRAVWMMVLIALMALFATAVPESYNLLRQGAMGVLLDTDREGRTILTPIPGQAAANAGILAGDVLIAVDGRPLGHAAAPIAPRLGPAAGTAVTLTVARPPGEILHFTFDRLHVGSARLGITPATYALVLVTAGVLFVLAYAVPAIVIAWQRPRDWVAALVWITLVLVAIFNSRAGASLRFSDNLAGLGVAAGYHVAVLLVLLTFPDGRLAPRWARWYLPVGMAWIIIKLAPLPGFEVVHATPVWIVIDFAIFGIAVAAQIWRFRQSADPSARQQTKWLVYGFVMAFLAQYAYYIPLEFVMAFRGRSVYEFGGSLVNHALMLILPIAFTHAVLRYRLYQIDLVINRTLVYGSVTAILAGVYSASVTVFRNVSASLTGQTSDLATWISILIIVALLTPVKDRLQRAVDERFRYDSRSDRLLKEFEAQVASRLQAVQAGPVIRRLLECAVRAYGASGGTAELVDHERARSLGAVGQGPEKAVLTVPIRTGGHTYGRVSLGARRSGAAYGPGDVKRLEIVACAVAAAIEQDQDL